VVVCSHARHDQSGIGRAFQADQGSGVAPRFPGYTPVGQIELKDYPEYRKASSSGAAEFWTLFMHIKQTT